MQRATADLLGIAVDGAVDDRRWLDHGLWGAGGFALRHDARPAGAPADALPADYAFVRVDGDGVHEIAVGPVHAGIIEPGHFRFSVVGEKVLRLEEHLGYVHKGIERRFTELPAHRGSSPGRAGVGRQHGGLRLGVLHGAGVGQRHHGARTRAPGCAR